MLDKQGAQNLFNQIHTLWVEPEIEARRRANCLPEGFRIRRCLVKLPKEKPPIVEFNEEIKWQATCKKPRGIAFEKGDPVFLTQIEGVESVRPPTVEGERVAFFFIYWAGDSWQLVFDGNPNPSDSYLKPSESKEWDLGKAIAESINLELKEMAVHFHDATKEQVRAIGLWPAPALLPYPLSKIANLCQQENLVEAREILISHCTTDFITDLACSWDSVEAFVVRKKLFEDTLQAHRDGRYALSIHTLMPQIEGVITEWVYSKIPAKDVPRQQDSKTKKFKDIVTDAKRHTFTDQRIIESIIDFILRGPVFETFKDWLQPIQKSFPNRHVILHGRFDASILTEENSIKAFLLLDTLYHIMKGHNPNPD